MRNDITEALRIFDCASAYITHAGLDEQIEWQKSVDMTTFSESEFLCQAAWVILCGGFREATVRRLFDNISLCFCDWESAREICETREACAASALRVFKHRPKIMAILDLARRIDEIGFISFKKAVQRNPVSELQTLSHIGPITAIHLAKNLGLDVAKPDRHLVRLTKYVGFDCANDLCHAIGARTGEKAGVVDLILWRYIADTQWSPVPLRNSARSYQSFFCSLIAPNTD